MTAPSATSSTATTEVKLASFAGVHPSTEWLEACRQHLRQLNDINAHNEDDAILHQVLHSDLRDVVRSTTATAAENEATTTPGKTLRQAITASLPTIADASTNTTSNNTNSCKAILPATFSILIQIEELLDVSLNAEARLNHGVASSASPTPVGNQRLRCLKMKCSDGFCPNGDAFLPHEEMMEEEGKEGEGSNHPHIIAMEIAPIPSLSVHSKAGIKVLLRGPITIRLGVLMLHPGNATVLGGCVPALVPVQKKAFEMASRVAGVGVDPTVKALIWNPHTGAEEDEDEGEHESGDVLSRPQNVPTTAPQPTNNAAVAPLSVSTTQPSRSAVNISTVVEPPPFNNEQTTNSTINRSAGVATLRGAGGRGDIASSASTSTTTRAHHQNQQPMDRFLQRKQANTTSTTRATTGADSSSSQPMDWSPTTNTSIPTSATSTTTTTRPISTNSKAVNPYSSSASRSNPYASLRSTSTVPANNTTTSSSKLPPTTFKTPSTSIKRSNRRLTGAFPETPVDLTSPDEVDPTSQNLRLETNNDAEMTTPQPSNVISSQESFTSLQSTALTPSITSTPHRSTAYVASSLLISPTALTEPISFAEMRSLILQAVKNPNLYEQCANKVYVVPMKMTGLQRDFNIVKQKGGEGKKKNKLSTQKSKYEYSMTCRFVGSNEDSGTISCKIDSPILVPFFRLNPVRLVYK